MQVTTYSAAATTLVYMGHVFGGFADGEDVISVARGKDAVNMTIGMQGDAVFSQTTDKSGTITVKLLAGSATNEFLNKKAQATDAGTLAIGDLIISEVGTEAGVSAEKCIIQKIPDYGRGETAKTVEWVFLSPKVQVKHDAGVEV